MANVSYNNIHPFRQTVSSSGTNIGLIIITIIIITIIIIIMYMDFIYIARNISGR